MLEPGFKKMIIEIRNDYLRSPLTRYKRMLLTELKVTSALTYWNRMKLSKRVICEMIAMQA